MSSAPEDVPGASDSPQSKRFTGKFATTLKKAPVKKQTIEEKLEQGVDETFNFYSRQHLKSNVGFDEMDEMMKKVDLGEFTCFIRDFQIALPK